MIRARIAVGGVVIAAITLAAAWLHPLAPTQDTAGPSVEAQGVLVSVDPEAETFVIAGPAGTQEFYVTPDTVIELGRTERIRFHDLRHSCATLLLVQGVAPRVVMEILGHSQIAVTMNTYSHVLPALQREAAARLEALLGTDA